MNMNQNFLREAQECERRWAESGLLDGIMEKFKRSHTAVLLESQRLVNELPEDHPERIAWEEKRRALNRPVVDPVDQNTTV